MKKTTANRMGIMFIISLLKRKYPTIFNEDYIEHYITEANQYFVFLTNNSTIQINRMVARDAESNSFVADESLDRIINTFKKI